MHPACSLTVTNFSAIRRAEIQLGQLTLVIGPQASGKSVLSKLCYFFNGVYWDFLRAAAAGSSLAVAKDHVRRRFVEWFPVSAWGKSKFEIEFVHGPLRFRLVRSTYLGDVKDEMRISIPKELQAGFLEVSAASKKLSSPEARPGGGDDATWRLHDRWWELVRGILGESYIERHLFIPAGRSFFTSLGKAVAAFEHAGLLDPSTVAFGRMFARMRDRGFLFPPIRRSANARELTEPLHEVLGGKIISENDRDFVLAADGRRVPFAALSSGQQEIIPLIVTLESLQAIKSGTQFVYIEEPEAHLYPAAQSVLVQVLAAVSNAENLRAQVLLTTHSPYVLAKANNLLKAGRIAIHSSAEKLTRLDSILPQKYRLAPGTVRAYAIRDGVAEDLMDEHGLIVAEYLDEVSSCIASEFADLLELEATK